LWFLVNRYCEFWMKISINLKVNKMENQKMIELLQYCAAQCTHCYDACQLEKEMDMSICKMNDLDCADICRLTAQILERKSDNSAVFLKASEEMCDLCATECEKHAQMEHCKKCAEACRKCANQIQEFKVEHHV
jgi:response regulator RpfG family c-di-GMP phosphodiesterase